MNPLLLALIGGALVGVESKNYWLGRGLNVLGISCLIISGYLIGK